MAEESMSAGRIELQVVADLTGFERKLQADIDRRVRDVRARIKAEIDARGLAAQARAAAKQAEAAARIKVRIEVDQANLRRDLAEKLATASDRAVVKVRAEVDSAALRSQVEEAARGAKVQVPVGTDTAPVDDDIDKTTRKKRRPIKLDVDADDARKALFELIDLIGSPLLKGAGLLTLAAAATSAAGGLFAVVGAATQAIGVLPVLAGGAVAAGQGLATLLIGFSGIGEAVGALGAAEQQGGASAQAAAAAREAAAERIKSAQERVKAAVEAVTEAQKRAVQVAARVGEVQQAAAERVARAERSLSDAHRAAQRAQEGLTEARKRAIERLEDLQLAVKGGALDEEGAVLALQRAKERLDKVNASSFSSDLDRREADLAYRQSLQRLEEVRERNGDLAEEQAKANAQGVEGSDEVVAAKERIAEANQRVADEEKDLAKARVQAEKDVAAAREDAAKAAKAVAEAEQRVKDARAGLAKAQRDAAKAASSQAGAQSALAAAMDKLSPAGRRFARFVHSELKPAVDEIRYAVQEAMLPGVQDGLTKAMPLVKTWKKELGLTGKAVGDIASEWGAFFGSKSFNRDVSTIMGSNTKAVSSFGKAGKSAFAGVTNIMVVAAPLVERFAKWIERGAQKFEDWTAAGRKDNSMAEFFDDAWSAASKLWDIVTNIGSGLLSIGKAAKPSGKSLLSELADASKDFAEWAAKPETQQKLQRFFENATALAKDLGKIVKDVIVFLGNLADKVSSDPTFQWIIDRLSDIVGLLKDWSEHPIMSKILVWTTLVAGLALAFAKVYGAVSKVGKALKTLAKFTGLSKLASGLKSLFKSTKDDGGDGKGKGKGSDSSTTLRGVKSIVVSMKGGTVVVNGGKTTGSGKGKGKGKGGGGGSVPDVDLPGGDGDGKSDTKSKKKTGVGSKLKKGAKGVGKGLGGIIAAVGVDALMDVDWGKALKGVNVGELGGKAAGLAGKLKGSVPGFIASLIVDPIADAIGDGKGGGKDFLAGALKGGSTGAGLGTWLGPIGGIIGGAYGAGFGGVNAVGGNMKGAGIGAVLGGLPGLLTGGLLGSPDEAAKKIAPFLDKIKQVVGGGLTDTKAIAAKAWSDLWSSVQGGTATGTAGVTARMGAFLGVTKGKWTELRADAPPKIRAMWADIQRDIDAGRQPSQAKIDAFVKAGGDKFVQLKKDAPAALKEGWKQVVSDTGTELGKAKAKVGEFADGSAGTLAGASKRIDDKWGGLIGVLKAPIRAALSAYNNAIVPFWNKVAELAGKIGVALPRATTVDLAGFADGGVVPAGAYGVMPGIPTPGRDSMLAMVGAGEAWLRPEVTSWLGEKTINAWNWAAKHGQLPRYADGGVVSRLYASSRRAGTAVSSPAGVGAGMHVENHIYTQPGQNEDVVAARTARRIGQLVRP